MIVLCFGHTSYNISCLLNGFPSEDNKYNLNDKIESGGGSGVNISSLLGIWGIETYLASTIGSDDNGNKIKKELEQSGVKLDYIETFFDKPTPLTFNIINSQNGSVTSFNLMKDNPHLKKEEWLVNPNYIISDCNEYHATLTALNKYTNIPNIIFASELTAETLELCKYAKYLVCSQRFVEDITKVKMDINHPETLVNVYNFLLQKYPRSILIITLGENGVLYSLNGNIKIMQGLKKIAKDKTGTGDIFRGAFAYGLLSGYDLERSIQLANIAGGLSVEKIGNITSIPTLNEVLILYNEKFGQPTQKETVESI